ncbi:MAG: hypothetical protein ABIH46_02450 [Chloroflexota bacterium]
MSDPRCPLQQYADDLRWQDALGFTDYQSDVWDELRAEIPNYDEGGWLTARAIFEAGMKSGYRDCKNMSRLTWRAGFYFYRIRRAILRLVGRG